MFRSTMAIKHAFAYQKSSLASRKNLISSAISTLLTYSGIFRQNGHDFVYFIFCYVFGCFFFIYKFYEEMQ